MKQFYKVLMAFIACNVFLVSFASENNVDSRMTLKDVPSVTKNLKKTRASSSKKRIGAHWYDDYGKTFRGISQS